MLSEIQALFQVPLGPLSAVSVFTCWYKHGQNIEELGKFLYVFFFTLATHSSYNLVLLVAANELQLYCQLLHNRDLH